MTEWKKIIASNFCTSVTDGTHDSPKVQKEGRKLITSKHLKEYSIDFKNAHLISELDYKKIIARSNVEQWDILYSMIGTIGKIYIETNPTVEYACKNVGIFKFGGNKQKALWMYYYLKSSQVNEYINANLRGSTQSYIPLGILRNLPVLFPSEEEQNKIISILQCLDKKIELNNRMNENLEEQAKAIFRKLFLSHDVIPDNWQQLLLEDVTELSAGGDKPKIISDNISDECCYPVYSNGVTNNGLYGFTNKYKISEKSVTVSARGTIGFVCLRHIPYTPIVRLITLIPNTKILSAEYLYLWLKNTPIHGTGTTQQQLTVPNFRKNEIIVPVKTEMDKFTEIVQPLFEQIWDNEEQCSKLADVRNTILPKLMSGEIDVSDIEI